MARKVLEVEDVGKNYQLGKIGSGTLSGDLKRAFAKGKEDDNPDLAATSGSITALNELNFSLMQGEVLGLIGKNGAGKSTLLKLLSRVTAPSRGRIRIRGRIASLLEVGTGMHPELTGRENVYLNGAILGMSKGEIRSKFDEIVDFSGCETFIDTPVKRYSSGMKVRLGFAVAAHLDPEILIVDEVLAVGDAAFQKKAIARMQAISSNGDRTVIFVSHNVTSVRSLCTRAIWLEAGRVAYDGDVETAIANYLGYRREGTPRFMSWPDASTAPSADEVRIVSATMLCPGKAIDATLSTDDPLQLEVIAEHLMPEVPLDCTLKVHSESGIFLASTSSIYFLKSGNTAAPGQKVKFTCHIPANFFNQGVYRFSILMLTDGKHTRMRLEDAFRLTFAASARSTDVWLGTPKSLLLPGWQWGREGID